MYTPQRAREKPPASVVEAGCPTHCGVACVLRVTDTRRLSARSDGVYFSPSTTSQNLSVNASLAEKIMASA